MEQLHPTHHKKAMWCKTCILKHPELEGMRIMERTMATSTT